MEREAKLRKLNAFRRQLPHISASGLEAVLSAVKNQGLPDLDSRDNMREARDLENKTDTPFGPILQHIDVVGKDGETKHLPIAHPFALLWTSVVRSEGLRKLLKRKFAVKPPTPEQPWQLVLYSDEVTPGNPLSTDNQRKFQAVYFSFLELGMAFLSHEESWWCVLIEYSKVVKTVSADMSQVFAEIVKLFFSPEGYNLKTSGILLPLDDEAGYRLFATLAGFLQDGGAHKITWQARGDGASKYCLLCKNLFTESSHICDEDGANLLRCNAIKKADLVPAESDDLRKAARYLEANAGMPPDDFTELQQALGISHHAHSILLDRSLDSIIDPANQLFHDWMHGIFVDGVANVTIYLLFEVFILSGVKTVYEDFSKYVALWDWPKRLQMNKLHEIFSRSRRDKHRDAQHIKCQASDMLSLMGVLALFVVQHLLPKEMCEDACHAFLALADFVDLVCASAKTNFDPCKLDQAAEKFLGLFVNAFTFEWLTPKFHWLLHIGDLYARIKLLPNCFVLERRHRIPKRYATELSNTSRRANSSLLMEVTSHHLALINLPGAFDNAIGLVGGRPCSKKLRKLLTEHLECENCWEVLTGACSRHSTYGICHTGDVVLIKEGSSFRAGQVLLHACVENVPLTVVSAWDLHSLEAELGYAKWHLSRKRMLIETKDILDTVCHTKLSGATIVTTLLPPEFR